MNSQLRAVKPYAEIAINGRFLSRSITGVERYSREILFEIDNEMVSRPDLAATLYCPPNVKQLPQLRRIAIRQVGVLTGHAWEQVELPFFSKGKTLFCPANTAPLISLYSSQPVIACVHDLSYRYYANAYKRNFRSLYNIVIPAVLSRANSIITVSESERSAIAKLYPQVEGRIETVQNGGAPAEFIRLSQQGQPKEDSTTFPKRYVIYVGSLSKRKNINRLINAAVRITQTTALGFVFVGSLPKGFEGTDLTIPADVSHKIVFAGQIDSSAQLVELYRGATCLLFPSLYESSPLPPTEAMYCGCPVVVSNIPSIKERCGDAAIYCDPEDIDDIVAKVLSVVNSPALQEKLRKLGHAWVKRYSWSKAAHRTLEIIERAVSTLT